MYSEEFYQLAKKRLKPDGVVQAWLVNAEAATVAAELRSVCNCFPYVRCFRGFSNAGLHVVASMQPIDACTPAELANRLPAKARADLLEWSPTSDAAGYFNQVLSRELPVDQPLLAHPEVRIIDDLPYNEYFMLRRLRRL